METNSRLPILIIGGGIGGMMTAIALSRKKIHSIVLEQAPEFREIGAGFQLCPNVFKMFDYLGMMKQIQEIAFFPDNLVYMDGVTAQEYARMPLGKNAVSHFGYPHGTFHRAELHFTLLNECKKSPLVNLVTSAKVVTVEERDDKVFATTDQGKVFEGGALVGCDGLWSSVRDYILGVSPPRVTRSMSYRSVVPMDQIPKHLHSNDIVHWHKPNSHIVLYPIGTKGLFNILAEVRSNKIRDGHDTAGDPKEFDEIFADSPSEVLEMLKFVNKSRLWMMCDREPISNWTKGRMTLLGDSAHATLPHMAQGAGMAIEDAVVLAECIEKFDGDYHSAFQAYQQERYIRTALVQIISRQYAEVHYAEGIARELRNYLFSHAKPELLYDLFDLLYKGIEIS